MGSLTLLIIVGFLIWRSNYRDCSSWQRSYRSMDRDRHRAVAELSFIDLGVVLRQEQQLQEERPALCATPMLAPVGVPDMWPTFGIGVPYEDLPRGKDQVHPAEVPPMMLEFEGQAVEAPASFLCTTETPHCDLRDAPADTEQPLLRVKAGRQLSVALEWEWDAGVQVQLCEAVPGTISEPPGMAAETCEGLVLDADQQWRWDIRPGSYMVRVSAFWQLGQAEFNWRLSAK